MGEYAGVPLDELVLTSARLTLRPWRRADADEVLEIMRDRSMLEFLTLPDPYTRADAEAFVTKYGDEGRAAGTGIGSAVIETSTGRLVGSAAIRFPSTRTSTAANIGYWIAASARGNRYAAEATRALTGWAFAHGIPRVEIRCATGNVASAKSALAAGFRFEGVLRGEGATPSGPADHAVFGRLPGDPDVPASAGFPPLPHLGDGVVNLRQLSPGDADAVIEQESDPLTRSWEFTEADPDAARLRSAARRAALDWVLGRSLRTVIVDTASGAFAGTLDVYTFGPPQVGLIGYVVHPAFRGRGYAGRSLRLVTPWLFEHAGFARLELGAKAANIASQKAALAGGFEREVVSVGRLRNPDGTFSDEVRFALVTRRVTDAGTE